MTHPYAKIRRIAYQVVLEQIEQEKRHAETKWQICCQEVACKWTSQERLPELGASQHFRGFVQDLVAADQPMAS